MNAEGRTSETSAFLRDSFVHPDPCQNLQQGLWGAPPESQGPHSRVTPITVSLLIASTEISATLGKKELLLWCCTRSTSPDHSWAALSQLSHFHSLQPGVWNIIFVYFNLLNWCSSVIATDYTPGDEELVVHFSHSSSSWPQARGDFAKYLLLILCGRPWCGHSSSGLSPHPLTPPSQGSQPHPHHSWTPAPSLTPSVLAPFKIAQALACPIPNRWSDRVTSSVVTPESDWDPERNNTVPLCLTDTGTHPVLQPALSRPCTQYCHYRSGWKLGMQAHLNQSIFNFT